MYHFPGNLTNFPGLWPVNFNQSISNPRPLIAQVQSLWSGRRH